MKKRIFMILLACFLLATSVIVPVSADEASDLDSHLIVHFDFEGENIDEQMQDKAPAGVSKENLSFFSTQDEEGKDLSYVKDGVAHIDHSKDNYMWVKYNTENNIGTDIANLKTNGEFTVFTAVTVSGSPQAWATFVDMNDVVRMLVQGAAGNTANYSTLRIRGGTTSYTGANVEWLPKNGDIFHDTDVIYIAVTYEYDAATKLLIGTTFHSYDFGKTWTETPGSFEDIAEFLPTNTHICLGKTRAGNRFTRFDDGSSFDFYDFRIYDVALNLDQVKSIKTGHEPAEEDTTEEETTIEAPTDEVTDAPKDNETTAPKKETETKKPTSTDNTTEEKGCGAGIATGTVAAIVAAAFVGMGITKKKKH